MLDVVVNFLETEELTERGRYRIIPESLKKSGN